MVQGQPLSKKSITIDEAINKTKKRAAGVAKVIEWLVSNTKTLDFKPLYQQYKIR
jgi:ribosomal protein L17